MSAQEQMRAMLDELMGTARDGMLKTLRTNSCMKTRKQTGFEKPLSQAIKIYFLNVHIMVVGIQNVQFKNLKETRICCTVFVYELVFAKILFWRP